ncbi:hypothetical protein GW17_00031045 [Ensete ventricosum]|nr:hypothetical protein GW17_00031045 [Ensete ventricosum]
MTSSWDAGRRGGREAEGVAEINVVDAESARHDLARMCKIVRAESNDSRNLGGATRFLCCDPSSRRISRLDFSLIPGPARRPSSEGVYPTAEGGRIVYEYGSARDWSYSRPDTGKVGTPTCKRTPHCKDNKHGGRVRRHGVSGRPELEYSLFTRTPPLQQPTSKVKL